MLTILLGLIVPILLASSSPSSPQFVPGEMLVKFSPGTKGSAAVAQASQVSPPDLTALTPVIKGLEAEVGIPLRGKQLSSGNWIVLSVREDVLTDQVVQQLRARSSIEEVQVTLCEPAAPEAPPSPNRLAIEFKPETSEAKAVAQKLSDGGEDIFGQLISDLEKYLNLPLVVQAIEETTVLAQIELEALTLILIDRLKALDEIESAQPNYILTLR